MSDRRYYLLKNLATGEIGMRRNMPARLAQTLNLALARWSRYQWIPERTPAGLPPGTKTTAGKNTFIFLGNDGVLHKWPPQTKKK